MWSLIADDEYEFVGKRILELDVLDLHFAAETGLTFVYAPTVEEVPHRQIVATCDIGHLRRHEDVPDLFIASHDQLQIRKPTDLAPLTVEVGELQHRGIHCALIENLSIQPIKPQNPKTPKPRADGDRRDRNDFVILRSRLYN